MKKKKFLTILTILFITIFMFTTVYRLNDIARLINEYEQTGIDAYRQMISDSYKVFFQDIYFSWLIFIVLVFIDRQFITKYDVIKNPYYYVFKIMLFSISAVVLMISQIESYITLGILMVVTMLVYTYFSYLLKRLFN